MQCSPTCGQCRGSLCTNSLNSVDYESEHSEDWDVYKYIVYVANAELIKGVAFDIGLFLL